MPDYIHKPIDSLLELLCEEAKDCPAKKHGGFNQGLILLKTTLDEFGKINDKDLLIEPEKYSINEKDFSEIFSTLRKYYKFKEIRGESLETYRLIYNSMIFSIIHGQGTIFTAQKMPT